MFDSFGPDEIAEFDKYLKDNMASYDPDLLDFKTFIGQLDSPLNDDFDIKITINDDTDEVDIEEALDMELELLVSEERYEEAAIIRDKLKVINGTKS